MTTTSSPTPSVQLNHVAITVTDNARATRFYVDVLGLKELPRPDFGIPGAWLATETGMIHLVQLPKMPEPRDPVAHFALQVPTDQIAPLSEAVVRGGGQVTSEPQLSERFGITVTTAFCRDTEGNAFELTDAA